MVAWAHPSPSSKRISGLRSFHQVCLNIILHTRRGLGDESPPAESRDGAPIGVWGTIHQLLSAQKYSVLHRIVLYRIVQCGRVSQTKENGADLVHQALTH